MIDNLVILSNVVLALWVVVRAILLDAQIGWFDPAGTAERGDVPKPTDRQRRKPTTVRTGQRR